MTTYFSNLPKDITNILQNIADTRAINRFIARNYWIEKQRFSHPNTEIRDRLLAQGITTHIEPEEATDVRLIITDINPVSYDILPEYIRDFVANINSYTPLPGINKVIKDHNLNFQLGYINNKLTIQSL